MHLVLVGLMGSGKSAVGRACAARRGWAFVDTDELVEAAAGASVARLFATRGEAAFRRLEGEAVAEACSSEVPAVIALGGGAVLSAENRRRAKGAGFVVWLTADADTLGERVGTGEGRPLLAGGNPGETLRRLAREREAAYREVADAVVDTTGRSVEEVAEAVLREFDRAVEARAGR